MKKAPVKLTHGYDVRPVGHDVVVELQDMFQQRYSLNDVVQRLQDELNEAKDKRAQHEAAVVVTIAERILDGQLPVQCLKVNWAELDRVTPR